MTELRDKLQRDDVIMPRTRVGQAQQPVLMFSGHGSQWGQMGQQLATHEPVFRQSLRRCSEALAKHSGWSIAELVESGALANRLNRVDEIQPAIFAMQVALMDTLRHYGVTPAAVLGHSMGEVAA